MLFINTINDEEVLNSYNFARKADVVYSEIISKKNFEKINKENPEKFLGLIHNLEKKILTDTMREIDNFLLNENI